MSYEAWNEDESCAPDGYISDEESDERVRASFIAGAQACREMMARFVEQGGDPITAASIRANWNPSWGKDPGVPGSVARVGGGRCVTPRPTDWRSKPWA